METSRGLFHGLALRSYERLLRFYPARFRREFAAELREVFLDRMNEPDGGGAAGKAALALRELSGLTWSVMRERWHEWRTRWEGELEKESQIMSNGDGSLLLRGTGVPGNGLLWWFGWVVSSLLAIPAAMLLATPFAMPYIWLHQLATRAGWRPEVAQNNLLILGFFTAFALLLAVAQWLLLRRLLPNPGRWFAATALGAWLGGATASGIFLIGGADILGPGWILCLILAADGLVLGLAQWLALRRYALHAGWLMLIDLVAFASLVLLPRVSITNTAEMVRVILCLALPGAISGLGVWLLLHISRSRDATANEISAPRVRVAGRHPATRVAVATVAAAAIFFFLTWAYAASQLSLAKDRGAYPTVEEAVVGYNNTGFGDAKVVSITNIQTGPNRHNGSQPYVWFGTATVKLDRVPAGLSRSSYFAGSYYIHTRDGWVFMGEGTFPEFVGWVMDLYNLEGVREFRAGNSN
ncbi:MAG TPA: hypothetical protein VN452_02000 [Longilinea sp.]|nr:hypothetical protein [Longilinea sp.]